MTHKMMPTVRPAGMLALVLLIAAPSACDKSTSGSSSRAGGTGGWTKGLGGAVGSGGSAGSGGTTSITGSGGSVERGGTTGSGGSAGAAGSGAGGTAAAGGATGSGAGGKTGTGGAIGGGGSTLVASGGRTGTGSGGDSAGGQAAGGTGMVGKATGGTAGGGTSPGTGGVGTGGAGTSSVGTGGATGGSTGTSTWKQCAVNDKMPENPGLKVDPSATGYTTAIDTGGYVTMLMGTSRPSCITDAIAKRNLAELDTKLRWVVELVGFPAFANWKKGYFLNWVILNSGIAGATMSGEGGGQGNRWGHMDFESTQTCPCTWDDYQSFGAWHECVHALQAELWKYNNEASGWIHEAHNEFLTDTATALANKVYSIGWFSSLILQMPHVPIESMGLTKDDSIAGPADQNAGAGYVNDQVRYGLEIFFFSLTQLAGRGFDTCLWTEPPANNSKSVFQVMQGLAGDAGVASAIMAFAANSAILDFGDWTEAVRSTMKGNWNNSWWFYMFPGGDGTTAFSPPTKTLPHHQGRNVIPIQLASGATSVTVEFTPDAKGSKGTTEKMQAQLVYRDKADKPVYGTVFSSGQSTIDIPNGARNNIVNLAVAVTNPNAATGGDDGSGKGFDAQEHFSYKARIVSGGTVAPTTTRPW